MDRTSQDLLVHLHMLRQHHLQQAAQDSRRDCPNLVLIISTDGDSSLWTTCVIVWQVLHSISSHVQWEFNVLVPSFSFSKHLWEWSGSCTLPYFKTLIKLLISYSPSWMLLSSLSLSSYVRCSSPLLIFVVLSDNLELASFPDIKPLTHKRLLYLKVRDLPQDLCTLWENYMDFFMYCYWTMATSAGDYQNPR